MKKKQRHSKLRGVNERKKKYATSKEEFTGKDCTKINVPYKTKNTTILYKYYTWRK